MSQSPSKRQRTSIDTFVSRSNNDVVTSAQSNPTTPTRRASYLSPTKASLARSHPKLLTKSPGRAATEPRRSQRTTNVDHNLPLEIALEGRSASTSTETDLPEPQNQNIAPTHRSGGQGDFDFAAAIAQTFRDAPAIIHGQNTDNRESSRSHRHPLSPRQPRAVAGTSEQHAINDDERPNPILPKLVRQSQSSQERNTHNEDDMDLPPTPVQLGLSEAPYRPRGLASSSSGGSRGGSGKHRRRTRNKEVRSITSSPLKPRAQAEANFHPTADTMQKDLEAEETRESDAEDESPAPASTGISPEAQQKQLELSEFRAELASLQKDLEKLQSLSQGLPTDTPLELDDDMQRVLTGTVPTFNGTQDSPEDHLSFMKDPNAYLRLFSPANLQLLHSSEAKVAKGLPKIVHNMTIMAPEPWLPSSLRLMLQITIDGQSASIESVTVSNSTLPGQHIILQQWIEMRLASPLHKFNVAGLVHGIGQYFEACIKRSSTFLNLSQWDNGLLNKTLQKRDISKLDANRALSLTPYMNINQLTVPMSSTLMEPDDATSKQILLTYDLQLTWTGNVQSNVQITCQNIGPKAQKGSKDLFQKLLMTEGVEGAIERVRKLLDQEDNDVTKKQQSQAKKVRRRIVAH